MLFQNDNLHVRPHQSWQINLGSEGMYFLKIETVQESKTIKAIGRGTRNGYNVNIKDINTKFVSSPSLKRTTLLGQGDFTFEEGDSIRIWAFRKDIYAWPERMRINESDNINFVFNSINRSSKEEIAYPDSVGALVPFVWNEDTLYCSKINNEYVYQGDIILTEEQVKIDSTKGATNRIFIRYWPDSKVYYDISEELKNDTRIEMAINYWNINAPVKFIKRTNEVNYVFFIRDEESNSSFIGKDRIPGKQKLKLTDDASYGIILHEMGHAVGLIHEHSRSDRNYYVKIYRENIESGNKYNFDRNRISDNEGDFDFNSIMLYSMTAFSKDGLLKTITKKDGSDYFTQRSYLSRGDIQILERIYGEKTGYKPNVNVYFEYNFSESKLIITGEVADEGATPITQKAIYWKRTGDEKYSHKNFSSGESFKIEITDKECAEYIFYATATNSNGTSSSRFLSTTIPPSFTISATEVSANSAKLVASIETGHCINFFMFLAASSLEKVSKGEWDILSSRVEKQADYFEESLRYLEPDKAYFAQGIIVYEVNEGEPEVYSSEIIEFKTNTGSNGNIEYGELVDTRGGETRKYKTVKIGDQWWMAENLAYLPAVHPSSSESYTESRYYVYGYQGSDVTTAKQQPNYTTYGVLYNWPAALTSCPSGWHLPTDNEWKQLEMAVGMSQSEADGTGLRGTNEGTKLKATSGWNNNGNGTDDFGFSALPGGYRYNGGGFYYIGRNGYWWSSTEYSTTVA